jgi:hypothetical protein
MKLREQEKGSSKGLANASGHNKANKTMFTLQISNGEMM